MHKVKDFLKRQSKNLDLPGVSGIGHQVPLASQPLAPIQQGAFPTEQDVFRYRKQRGVNFGAFFLFSSIQSKMLMGI